MTKGKIVAILIHALGLTLGLTLVFGVIILLFDMVESWLIAAATVVSVIFYCVMLVIVTARVLNGTDTLAEKFENFIENK
jgi:inner membrane protein involved in colicin E2 resistance